MKITNIILCYFDIIINKPKYFIIIKYYGNNCLHGWIRCCTNKSSPFPAMKKSVLPSLFNILKTLGKLFA